ncbi:MAG TPA: bifunctional phosphoribosylaminoimidazolecarboxamide formyltransferase/IMP cyclohydrolase [Candidatus Acidoferrum sp.]|nr:bifunctional phosphoribosylaminoimidazolecarboxamide formyltransferase/IMP cyclohydrolase [Candidatus Angelobacter sp.]HXD80858.1 bifunctional phosphoribosylaminoimidazolecarboxamide formyltransferase/IMP cyclohydrolase [Candidatus Acidoferrum sp.]
MPTALLSVSDKTGLAAFARGLQRLGYELFATGSTLQAIQDAAVDARPVSDLTGFPEMMDGRIKTLHPGVHGGILARRDRPEHMAALEQHRLREIDVVCCNLYPFVETVTRKDVTFEEAIEQIDIGGPAMIRAAAKNHESVLVVVRPERYSDLLAALNEGTIDAAIRRRLAAEAFAHTSAYDSWIAAYMRGVAPDGFPPELSFAGLLTQPLKYGENEHQKAGFYRFGPDPGGLGGAVQLQGKELGFNNIQDASAAYLLVRDYERPAAAIVKHMNPCGLAVADDIAKAYRLAYECDTVSAFGGIVSVNRPLDRSTAEQIVQIVTHVVIAPEVLDEARDVLARRKSMIVLAAEPPRANPFDFDVRSVPGGFLVQEWDRTGFDRAASSVVTRRAPTETEWEQLGLAWIAVKHVKSNAIVLFKEGSAVGVGAGQMSRVEAVQIAVQRAGDRGRGSVMASDAFFPFPDGLEEGIRAGVTAVIQPGGSLKDGDVVAAADAAGVAMVLTGQRHFKH